RRGGGALLLCHEGRRGGRKCQRGQCAGAEDESACHCYEVSSVHEVVRVACNYNVCDGAIAHAAHQRPVSEALTAARLTFPAEFRCSRSTNQIFFGAFTDPS